MVRRITAIAISAVGLAAILPAPVASAQQVCKKRHGKRVCQTVKVAPAPPPIRASGYVHGAGIAVPTIGTSGPQPETHGATVKPGNSGSPAGVYCLILPGRPATASVAIVSPAGTPFPGTTPYVAWIPYAPDCAGNAVEVATWTETVTGGAITLTSSNLVSFSFVVTR
jgi:hypothetical protein